VNFSSDVPHLNVFEYLQTLAMDPNNIVSDSPNNNIAMTASRATMPKVVQRN
jgi:hypothetical protein